MLDGVVPTSEKTEFGNVILEITSGEFSGCKFYYDGISLGNELEDGSGLLHFEYHIVNDFKPSDSKKFENFLGDNIVSLLEEYVSGKGTSDIAFYGGKN